MANDGGETSSPSNMVTEKSLKLLIQFYFYSSVLILITFFMYFYSTGMGMENKPVRKQIVAMDTYSMCTGDNYDECHKPFFHTESQATYSTRYMLNVCTSPKALSTIMTAVMCYLHDPEKFVRHNRSIYTEYGMDSFCDSQNNVHWMRDLPRVGDAAVAADDYTHVLVVREPLEKFISGFLDKCVVHPEWQIYEGHCFWCKTNVTCFLEKLDEAMSRAKTTKQTMDTHHFYPQSWRCEVGTHLNERYNVLRVHRDTSEQFWRHFLSLIARAGVGPEQVGFIANQVKHSTNHSTHDLKHLHESLEQELMSSYHTFKLFIKIYFYDYVLFGFPLPVGHFS